MEYKHIGLIIMVVLVFALISSGCSIIVTRNYYSIQPKAYLETDSTACAAQLSTQSHKLNDGQQ